MKRWKSNHRPRYIKLGNAGYIDDVVREFISALNGQADSQGTYYGVEPVHTVKLGEIAELVRSFRESREQRSIPDMSDEFTKKLYSTYLSYLPKDQFSYPLKMNVDISNVIKLRMFDI